MGHPTRGVLRRLLDEPAGVALPNRSHVAHCAQCLGALADAREDVAPAAAATDSATAPRPRAARPGSLLRRPAAAALAVAVVLTGAGAAAAEDWFPIFRTTQLAPVALSSADLLALPDLSQYGDLALTSDPQVHRVASAAEAAAQSGLDVPEVTELPRGVTGDPVHQVGGQAAATFTFSAERAARAAAEAGHPLPPVPPGLDGSSVRLVAGPGVAQVWESSAGAPALVVGRAVAPSASSSGAPFEIVRDYLLSLPGLSEEIAAQLRTFTAGESTLPVPVPADESTTSSAQVDAVPAIVLETGDRTLAAVVWVDDGVVTAVAGSPDAEELLSVARDLQ